MLAPEASLFRPEYQQERHQILGVAVFHPPPQDERSPGQLTAEQATLEGH
jgi:hypothetical protein